MDSRPPSSPDDPTYCRYRCQSAPSRPKSASMSCDAHPCATFVACYRRRGRCSRENRMTQTSSHRMHATVHCWPVVPLGTRHRTPGHTAPPVKSCRSLVVVLFCVFGGLSPSLFDLCRCFFSADKIATNAQLRNRGKEPFKFQLILVGIKRFESSKHTNTKSY